VTDGDSAWAAKIGWIKKSMASLAARAARADELETQLAEAEAVVREQEVRSLFGNSMSEDAIETFVSHSSTLGEDEYSRWRDEKELMLLEVSAAKKEMPDFIKKKKGDMKEDKKEDKGKANVFEALLMKRRSESGSANPDTMNGNPNEPTLINQNTGDVQVNSGVNSGQLKTPIHKIAGSAGDNPADALENAQEESGVSLAGAQTGDDGEGVNPFRTLANVVTDAHDEKKEEDQERPGFDPVQ